MPNQRRCLAIALRSVLAAAILAIPLLVTGCLADCMWNAKGIAWVDADEDGVWDAGERPLCGVQFHVDDTWNHYEGVNRGGMTNLDGEASISVWLPGCPKVRFEVYVEAPPGYRMTTPARLPANRTEPDQVFAFGLAPLGEAGESQQAMPGCSCYQLGESDHNEISDMVSAPDGSIWAIVNYDGVAQYSAERQEWIRYKKSDGLAHWNARAIAPAEDGVVWFATDGGVSRYDGQSWRSYTVADGLPSDTVYQVVIGTDGTVWSTTMEGVARLDPDTDSWSVEDAPDASYSGKAVTTPDGSIWFLVYVVGNYGNRVSHLASSGDGGNARRWITYGFNDGAPMPALNLSDAIVAPDGSPWFGGMQGLLHFSLKSQDWQSMSWAQGVEHLAIGPDGTAWVATGENGFTLYSGTLGEVDEGQTWQRRFTYCALPIPHDCLEGIPKINALAVARDGAVWIGVSNSAIRCAFGTQ